MMWALLVIILWCPSWSHSQRIHSIAGPFRVIAKAAEQCPKEISGSEQIAYFAHFHRTPLRNVVSSGNLTTLVEYNDDIRVRVNLASWSNTAGWRDNAIVIKYPRMCEGVRRFFDAQYSRVIKSVFGELVNCPLLKGFYRFDNATVDFSSGAFKDFVYGKWRVDIILMNRKRQTVGCIRAFADTVPLIKQPTGGT